MWVKMRHDDIETVSRLPIFSDMSRADLDPLLQAAFLQRFPTGVLLAQQGMRADFLHGVVVGSVEIFASYGEAEGTVGIQRAGSVLLLGSVIDDQPLINSARTLDSSQILMVPAEPVRQLLRAHPGFALAIARELAREHRVALKELQSQKLRTSLERLANWILQMRRERGGSSGFVLPFQKRTLASLIGTSPENLSRNFQALADNGAQVRGNRLMITDIEKILSLARPAPELDHLDTEDAA